MRSMTVLCAIVVLLGWSAPAWSQTATIMGRFFGAKAQDLQ